MDDMHLMPSETPSSRRRFKEPIVELTFACGRAIRRKAKSLWTGIRRVCHNLALLLPFLVLTASLVLVITGAFRIRIIESSQYNQLATRYWAGASGTYAQISLFTRWGAAAAGQAVTPIGYDKSFTENEILSLREQIHKLIMDSQRDSSGKRVNAADMDGKTLWIDSYASEVVSMLSRADRTDVAWVSATITGVGGEYDKVQQIPMLYGSFFRSGDFDTRKIVLDQNLAFALFASYDVEGKKVMIGSQEYTITGVCSQIDSPEAEATYGEGPRAYIPFSELAQFSSSGGVMPDPWGGGGGQINASTDNIAVMYYSAVIPDPLSGLAMEQLGQSMEMVGKSTTNFLIIENSGRFSLSRIWDTVFPIGARNYASSEYRLPFYEHSARIAEGRIFYWWIIIFLCGFASLLSVASIYGRFSAKRRLVKKKKKTSGDSFDMISF